MWNQAGTIGAAADRGMEVGFNGEDNFSAMFRLRSGGLDIRWRTRLLVRAVPRAAVMSDGNSTCDERATGNAESANAFVLPQDFVKCRNSN